MANFARPSVDISRGSWTNNTGSTTNLWATIDEIVADDADYVISAIGANSTYEVQLSSVPPAVIPRNHLLVLRGRKDQSGGNTKGVTIDLAQGSTVIGTLPFPDLPFAIQQQNIDIPKSMSSGITDYSDLRVRLTSTGITTGGSSRRRAIVTGIALRVPAAVDLVDDLLTRWGITVDTLVPGVVTVNKGEFTGAGPTLAQAIWELYQAMKSAMTDGITQVVNPELDRKFDIAYGLWKVIEYERLRAEIIAGTYVLPPHQNQPEEIANIDAKIARFIASAKTADNGEPE
jgi:hypothetical protein